MSALRALVAVLAVAACHSKEPTPSWLAPAGEKPCQTMADHLVELMQPGGADAATVEALRHKITERCTQDRWTIDAQKCFGDAKSIEAIDPCPPMLTVDQRNAFDRAMAEAFDKPN